MLRAKLSIVHELGNDFDDKESRSKHTYTYTYAYMNIFIYANTHALSLINIAKFVKCENGTSGVTMPPSSTLKYCQF